MKKTILVIGTGVMGGGIAQTGAAAGDTIFLYDARPNAATEAKERIAKSLERAISKGYVQQKDADLTLSNLHPVDSLDTAKKVEIIIEAVKEDLETKQKLFAELETLAGPKTLLWSNTSMISITLISEPLRHPERLAGVHFFNPVPRMQLVEIIPGAKTSENTVSVARETMTRWGKTPVMAPNTPGFIVNRLLDALLREALTLHSEGVPPDAIDTAIRLGLNFPMGPFELMDLVGLDTTQDCIISQAKGMGRPATPDPTIAKLLEAGKRGRKSGEGFFKYP